MVLVLCFLMLIGFVISFLLVLDAEKKARAVTQRVSAVLGPHRDLSEQEALSGGIGRAVQRADFRAMLLQLLHYKPRRKVYYVLQLRPVLLLALVPALVFGFTAARFFGLVGWVLAPAAFVLFCRGFFGWCESRTQQKLYTQFPEALATVVRTVRVGLPVVEAIRVVAKESLQPTAREFSSLVEQTAIGVPLDEALRDMATLSGLPEYRFFATALSLQSQTGGGLTETLENLADTIRKRVAIRMRGRALASEARMSAYILGALPLVTGGILSVINPSYVRVLFVDPSGQTLLFVGIAMLSVGAFTMHTMIRKSLD